MQYSHLRRQNCSGFPAFVGSIACRSVMAPATIAPRPSIANSQERTESCMPADVTAHAWNEHRHLRGRDGVVAVFDCRSRHSRSRPRCSRPLARCGHRRGPLQATPRDTSRAGTARRSAHLTRHAASHAAIAGPAAQAAGPRARPAARTAPPRGGARGGVQRSMSGPGRCTVFVGRTTSARIGLPRSR